MRFHKSEIESFYFILAPNHRLSTAGREGNKKKTLQTKPNPVIHFIHATIGKKLTLSQFTTKNSQGMWVTTGAYVARTFALALGALNVTKLIEKLKHPQATS